MLAHGFRFFAKGQFSAKGHTHLRKTKEQSGTTRAPSAERVEKLLVDSSRSLASSVWAQRLCKLKINLWGRVWGVYVFQKKNCLETQKLWNENECPSTPAVSGELQSGPRLSTPNFNSNTSLQPPKRTTTSSISK